MDRALTLPLPARLPRPRVVLRTFLLAAIAATIGAGCVADARAASETRAGLEGARRSALAERALTLSAGVPADQIQAETSDLARLGAATPPLWLPLISQSWNRWAFAQRAGYTDLARRLRDGRQAYAVGLARQTANALDATATL